MARSRLREYFHSDYQPGERLLVQKIDFFILTFCCVSYFMNYVSNPPPPSTTLRSRDEASSLCHISLPLR